MSLPEGLNCKYAGRCGGCPEIHISYEQQLLTKQKYLEGLFSIPVKMHSIAPFGLRDRADLTFTRKDTKPDLGFYELNGRNVVDISACPQMSPALAKAYQKLREHLPPISLGSIRIRVSPEGKYGVWLDFPNQSVKELLEEKKWLESLLSWAYVEIGQKRKRLIFENGKHKLVENEYTTWFETYLGEDLKPFSLFGKVGGFTQPGFKTNKKMMEVIYTFLPKKPQRVLELCSGSGNFSFFLASLQHSVTAVEVDEGAIEAMTHSLSKFGFKDKIVIERQNLHGKNPSIENLFIDKDLVLADPPRSGLGKSLEILLNIEKVPKTFIYVSCFPDSCKQDLEKLKSKGYTLKRMEAVDQFPQTKHIELIALLERS